jgi:hypothetical protein
MSLVENTIVFPGAWWHEMYPAARLYYYGHKKKKKKKDGLVFLTDAGLIKNQYNR